MDETSSTSTVDRYLKEIKQNRPEEKATELIGALKEEFKEYDYHEEFIRLVVLQLSNDIDDVKSFLTNPTDTNVRSKLTFLNIRISLF